MDDSYWYGRITRGFECCRVMEATALRIPTTFAGCRNEFCSWNTVLGTSARGMSDSNPDCPSSTTPEPALQEAHT